MPDAIECEHLSTQKSDYDDELQSSQDRDEDDEHADELPWDGKNKSVAFLILVSVVDHQDMFSEPDFIPFFFFFFFILIQL